MKRIYLLLCLTLFGYVISAQNLQPETGPTGAGFLKYKRLKCYFAIGISLIPVDESLGYSMVPTVGLNLRAGAYVKDNVRLVGEFTRLNYSLSPFPGSILFDCYEMNTHFIAHQNELNTDIYLVTGLAVQNWLGTNVTYRDQFGDAKLISKVNDWTGGLNFGLGFEKKVDNFSVYGEFKVRLNEKGLLATDNLLDAIYSFGIRYDLPLKWQLAKAELKSGKYVRRGHLRFLHRKSDKKGSGNMPPNIYDLDLNQKK